MMSASDRRQENDLKKDFVATKEKKDEETLSVNRVPQIDASLFIAIHLRCLHFSSLSCFICFHGFIFEIHVKWPHHTYTCVTDKAKITVPFFRCTSAMSKCIIVANCGHFRMRSRELLSLGQNGTPIFICVLVFSVFF